MDRQPTPGAKLLEPSTKTPGHVRGMRSFPHFSNWLGMTVAGIEWKQHGVVPIVVHVWAVEYVTRERMLLRVGSELFNVSDKSIVWVLGRDGHYVAEAFLLNFRKAQERDVLANVLSTVTKKRLGF